MVMLAVEIKAFSWEFEADRLPIQARPGPAVLPVQEAVA